MGKKKGFKVFFRQNKLFLWGYKTIKMNTIISQRMEHLRKIMRSAEIEACFIPTADPHQSEYTAECWKFRAFLCGFTGSAGTLVVTDKAAGLWTDSRYFLQATEELKGSGIELFRMALPETPAPEEWLALQKIRTAGLDGTVFSAQEVSNLASFFAKKDICLKTNFEAYADIWTNRPDEPNGEIYPFADEFAGESVKSKMEHLRCEMEKTGADVLPLIALDEIAWLFNLRGLDVDYNPVGICFACVDQSSATLYANPQKCSEKTRAYLEGNGIKTAPYLDIYKQIESLQDQRVLLDKTKINQRLYECLPKSCTIIEASSPVTKLKSIKNATEIAGFKRAMVKDGIALTRFWKDLEEVLAKSTETLNEWTIGEKIADFRRQQSHYVCESFAPIVGYNDHGAVVHYEATPQSAYPVRKEGILLIDTGGQYLDGTTDITRTYALGNETPADYRNDYTCLLKGVIALSSAVFPAGTRGTQLDVLARQFIWNRNLNFLHGTGHGVGHFLHVHEGPQSIRMNENPVCLEAGMTLTNEPGVYRTGRFGVRIENMMLVKEQNTSESGPFLCFETLTLFPFDRNSMDPNLLTPAEKEWINNYHAMIYESIAPALDKEETAWLASKTDKII
jgi:Xaa-Pro aminopeptidase